MRWAKVAPTIWASSAAFKIHRDMRSRKYIAYYGSFPGVYLGRYERLADAKDCCQRFAKTRAMA